MTLILKKKKYFLEGPRTCKETQKSCSSLPLLLLSNYIKLFSTKLESKIHKKFLIKHKQQHHKYGLNLLRPDPPSH